MPSQLEPALVIIIMLAVLHRERALHPGAPQPHLGPLRRLGGSARPAVAGRSGHDAHARTTQLLKYTR